jgi:hypothetical protein
MNDSDSDSDSNAGDVRQQLQERRQQQQQEHDYSGITWSHTGLAPIQSPVLTGDRINLPHSSLEALLNVAGGRPLPSPLVFSLTTCDSHRRRVYGCVREFQTKAEECVAISAELGEKLGIDGAAARTSLEEVQPPLLRIALVSSLPKCEYLRIVPLEASYIELPDIRALLESHIRRTFSTISIGDVITVNQALKPSLPATEFHFLVADIRPGETCITIDTDVTLDVVPELDVAEEAVRKKFLVSQTSSNDEISDMPHGRASGTVLAENYRYFKYRTTGASHYRVELTPLNDGDCDLIISETIEKPNLFDHDYANVDKGISLIHFSVADSTSPFL